ncbi:cytidine and dCMP deaminase domain-containing protein 1 [Electrophorus electricus]|uniref:Cytidine and dCMP deaminase domain-containing protein 1 n=1 Tax=Electrophorus electricus TaxID=8005 RepID=A0A4W4HFS4_ELEEL|nr:cytidine and dCMP deaminase domain-containing protein 1 [Electrophorus electricus]XP_035390498.1 cytidine and dCMP deaminase domain-containing protein 1 [Electrophorus electricus]
MAASNNKWPRKDFEENGFTTNGEDVRDVKETSTQTDAKVQGHGPRLSKVNLFTLLSLWMELFPKRDKSQDNESARLTGLVVVCEQKVLGLHCSGQELHVGQVAVIRHGPRLKNCSLYFSRKPCSTCLKMLLNTGVSEIRYWPADAEVSLVPGDQEATLDAAAAEQLKSNGRPHICVPFQNLPAPMLQFAEETSRRSDFLKKMAADDHSRDVGKLFCRERRRNWDGLVARFLVADAEEHRERLGKMGLENFCTEPYFTELRQHMQDLIRLLASVASSIPSPEHGYGFYETGAAAGAHRTLPQEVVRHCIVQAALLAYRREDPKVGVGAVIWAEGRLPPRCDGTGSMYLVGCGYNAYPVGSVYAEYPQMDDKQAERRHRKYRYIIHAEQNAITFRNAEVKEEENTMLFVTKCPCDECVPLIWGAGIKQIYTTDLDNGKKKHDISYVTFSKLHGVQKFVWQKSSLARSAPEQDVLPIMNGCLKHRKGEDSNGHCLKRLRTGGTAYESL